tara:strand:+ start:32 stop:661 length:630 start_codon:yes stop_codon:yes gene_type:complete
MKILELFSGTHSIGKEFEECEVISVDNDNKFKPTHLCDILEFDYKKYSNNYFDYIHASPPCIMYSQTQISMYNRKKRHNVTGEMIIWNKQIHEELMKISDKLVLKTLEIIEYFKPKYWTIENPFHNNWNNIRKRDFMKNFDYTIVNYCMYNYPVAKPTIIFNNFNLDLKRCDKKHKHSNWDNFSRNIYERYKIPSDLVKEIKRQIQMSL